MALPDPRQLSAVEQVRLKLLYQERVRSGETLPRLDEVGFKVFSQTDEDGILLYLFSVIGTTNRRCVEICAGDGIECNTANLIVNHGWTGMLVDGDDALVQRGRRFYRRNSATYVFPPTFLHAWVTRDNVNELLRENGFEGEIDLFALDMDGMDYWIWDALQVVSPRVVVVEYLDFIGPEHAWTVPYHESFRIGAEAGERVDDFFGASLPAFVKLARAKGYRLVGCNSLGFNAFFVREDLGRRELSEIAVHECFRHPKVRAGIETRFPAVKDLPWVRV